MPTGLRERSKVMKKYLSIFMLIFILILIDQISKIIVLEVYSTSIGNDFMGIELVHNTGMAFGFNDGNLKNIFLTIFVLVIIINFLKKLS